MELFKIVAIFQPAWRDTKRSVVWHVRQRDLVSFQTCDNSRFRRLFLKIFQVILALHVMSSGLVECWKRNLTIICFEDNISSTVISSKQLKNLLFLKTLHLTCKKDRHYFRENFICFFSYYFSLFYLNLLTISLISSLNWPHAITNFYFWWPKSLLGIKRQKKLEKFTIFTWKPCNRVRKLIHQTWPLANYLTSEKSNCQKLRKIYLTFDGPLRCVSPAFYEVPSIERKFIHMTVYLLLTNHVIFKLSFILPANNITSSVQTMGAVNTNNVIWKEIVWKNFEMWRKWRTPDIAKLSA